ncbi:hypothetical protein NP493_584g02027 [Ridgeia piscesae]|uniref:Uncharacterized protein n=1 Tax=Ridgeia piscesae TaxID=27915 RepID=A0AAD9NP33_RIDPI|nr:hypothetical protein NP493_584g02027 [Ridgeia piscesae]
MKTPGTLSFTLTSTMTPHECEESTLHFTNEHTSLRVLHLKDVINKFWEIMCGFIYACTNVCTHKKCITNFVICFIYYYMRRVQGLYTKCPHTPWLNQGAEL